MKRVTKCHNCGDVIRLHGSFTAMLEEEIMINDIPETARVVKKKIKLCRDCAKGAGYKVAE